MANKMANKMEVEMDEDQMEIEALRTYILGICTAMGGFEPVRNEDGSISRVYTIGDEALSCFKDIRRAIRRDSRNNERIVLDALAEYNIVKTDLVPMILLFKDQHDEVAERFILACVELLVPMTWPLDRSTLDERDEDFEYGPNVIETYRKYKLELLEPGVFAAILSITKTPLLKPQRDRTIIDHSIILLVLNLFRNLAAIPDLNKIDSGSLEQVRMSHMQEGLVIQFFESKVLDTLTAIASNASKSEMLLEWQVIVLETFYNILKHIDPIDVFSYEPSKLGVQEQLHELSSKLSDMLTAESCSKRLKTTYTPSRHGRFGGTYVIDWDGKKQITHKQVGGYADTAYLVNGDKKENFAGKKRKLQDTLYTRKVFQDKEVLRCLKETAHEFIRCSFSPFFETLMKAMVREDNRIMKQDYARYHFLMKWFLAYYVLDYNAQMLKKKDKLHLPNSTSAPGEKAPGEKAPGEKVPELDIDLEIGVVGFAINLHTIRFTLKHLRESLDNKEWLEVQVAVECLREIFIVIDRMMKSEDEELREVADNIQRNIYYEKEYLDLFFNVLQRYKQQSYGYLKAVISFTDVLLRLLDQFQKGQKMMFVRKKKKQTKKKQTKKKKKHTEEVEEGIAPIVDSDSESDAEVDARQEREYNDTVFKFEAFEYKYVKWNIVESYITLLELYENLEPIYLMCITRMFHRMMVKRKTEYLFWKAPVLSLFYRILKDSKRLSGSNPGMKRLVEFINFAVRRFFRAAKEYPLLFVEAFVPTIRTNPLLYTVEEKPVESNKRD